MYGCSDATLCNVGLTKCRIIYPTDVLPKSTILKSNTNVQLKDLNLIKLNCKSNPLTCQV